MYCKHACSYYKKIESETTQLYRNIVKINEKMYLKIFIDKYDQGLGNNLFLIRVMASYEELPIYEEVLVMNKEKSVFRGDRFSKCLCIDGININYNQSKFFSIDNLGMYRRKTVFRYIYDILNKFDSKNDRKTLDLIIKYILKDDIKLSIEEVL